MRFAGKVAVVTGAASGIGKASVLKLAGEGAHVFAADIDEAGGRALAEQSNGMIDFIRCDVTKPSDIEALMNAAAAKAGGIDIVFNNAAAGGDRAPIDEITPEGWDRTMDLVLKSVAMGIRYAAPHMKHRKGELKTQANEVIAQMSANAQPVARGGQPEDIANAVAYLASEESSFMTGTHLLVDGGLTIGQRHAWDKETPGMFDALLAMEEAAKAGASA